MSYHLETTSEPTINSSAHFHTDIDEIAKTLELLQLELPDSNQQLAVQNLHPEQDVFAFFPMLPLEIRRLIWQKSLPGRGFISLRCSLCSSWREERLGYGKKVHKCLPKPPILLQVNQESRGVTLENYMRYHRVRQFYHGTRPKEILRPLYIDPKVDLVSITMYSMFDRPEEHPGSSKYSQYEQFFDKIHTLEMRDFRWSSLSEGWYKIFRQADGGFLNHFHGLRELHLVEPGDKSWETERSSWGPPHHKNPGIEILKQWFEENKGNRPPQVRRSVPEMILHAFRRRCPRSDDEHWNLARLELSLDDEDSDEISD